MLIPIAFLISDKRNRKILFSFFSLFIIGNLIQFSPEIAANHKFFNYFIIVGGMFTSFFIIKMWRKNIYLKTFSVVLIIFLSLSGIIDFFPIYNDKTIPLADYPINTNVSWIMKNTSPNANFLNTNYLYDDASIAGRKIFLGWPYFAWSQGYDTLSRDNLRKSLLTTGDLTFFCGNISKYKLDYAEIYTDSKDSSVNVEFFDNNFKKAYENRQAHYDIYDLSKCK